MNFNLHDRVLVLYSNHDPFFDGTIIAFSDGKTFAKVKDNGCYEAWVSIDRLRHLDGYKIEKALNPEPELKPKSIWSSWRRIPRG